MPLKLSDHIVNLVHLMRQYGDVDVYGVHKGELIDLDVSIYEEHGKKVIGVESVSADLAEPEWPSDD